MQTINFYGKTIKIDAISFCEKRRTKFFSFFNILGIIIFWIIVIIFSLILYNSNLNSEDILKAIAIFILIIGSIGFVLEFIFGKKSIVEITLQTGDKLKSPTLPDNKAIALYEYIDKAINKVGLK